MARWCPVSHVRFSPGLQSTDVSTREKWETCQLPPRDLTWPGGSLNGFTCSLMTRRPGLGQFPGCHRATIIVSEIRNLCQQTVSSGFSCCYSTTRLISHFKQSPISEITVGISKYYLVGIDKVVISAYRFWFLKVFIIDRSLEKNSKLLEHQETL